MLQPMKDKEAEVPFDYKCKDKFLVQWISIDNEEKERDAVELVRTCFTFKFAHGAQGLFWGGCF